MKKWMIKWMKGRVTSKDGTWHLNIPLFIDAIFVYNTHMYLNIYVLLFYTNESPCRTFNVLVRCVLHVIFILWMLPILAQGLSFECSILVLPTLPHLNIYIFIVHLTLWRTQHSFLTGGFHFIDSLGRSWESSLCTHETPEQGRKARDYLFFKIFSLLFLKLLSHHFHETLPSLQTISGL